VNDTGGIPRIPLQVSRDCVVASIQVDLSEAVLRQFRTDLLGMLHSSGASGVILDVSGVEIMDREDYEALRRTMAMARLMGARCILAGLRPGVVSSLVELDVDLEEIEAALNLDEALRLVEEAGGMEGRGDAEEPSVEDRAAPESDEYLESDEYEESDDDSGAGQL
jgi:rsbT antagonist protein RsbS